jgi:hypothetical protein
MGRAYRLSGAIVAETDGDYYLVGNTKEPCDFPAHGFETPAEIDAKKRPFVRLGQSGDVALDGVYLEVDREDEDLARWLAASFVIERTGSVSERLWRLVVCFGDPDADVPEEGAVDARWLGNTPEGIWKIVREAVLRCS